MSILIKLRYLLNFEYWKRNIKKILKSLFAVFGSIWAIIQLINYASNNTITNQIIPFGYIVLISFVFAILTNLQRLTFYCNIKDKDIKIKLVVGDVFKQKGNIVLATNTTFDTTMEKDFISPKSIQGRLEKKFYEKIEYLDSDIELALDGIKPVEILSRKKSKNKKYSIGTTIKLFHKKFKSYWVALADINEHGKPISSFANLQVGLEALWSYMLTNGHVERLVLPILGSGRSAINESRRKILKEIIYSFVAFSNEKKITEELVICIYPKDLLKNNIDLDEISKYLEYNCRFRYEKINNGKTSTEL